MHNGTSEVAQLRQRIAAECEAGWRALHELEAGIAQHEFIQARFQCIGQYHLRLAELVGEKQATTILCNVYNKQASEP